MAKRLQHRGGTTSQHSTFTGAVREVTVDTDKNTLVVHDGATAGGHPLATATNFTSTGIDDNATSTAITINSSEQVAIGTTSHTTGANLTLSGQGFLTSGPDSGSIAFGSNASYQGRIYQDNVGSDFYIENTYSSNNGDIIVKTNGSERLRVKGSGNVGIGTSSPSEKLNVIGCIRGDGFAGDPNYGFLFQARYDGTTPLELQGNLSGQGWGIQNFLDWGGNGLRLFAPFKTGTNTPMIFSTSGSERMRIDSSGNVGIGTTSISPIGSGYTTVSLDGASGSGFKFLDSAVDVGSVYANNTGMTLVAPSTRRIDFYTNSSERMRIEGSGDVYIGASSWSSGSRGKQFEINNNAVALRSGCSVTTTGFHNEFHNPNGAVGSISTSGSGTNFNTSSDYRLKENVNYDFDATTRLKQLKPARFNFITDADIIVDGFLAHEVQDVVPEAISGTKDAVKVWQEGDELPDGVSVGDNKLDENGNTIPEYQGIDQAKLVPLLVKTIQELEARITALETNNP